MLLSLRHYGNYQEGLYKTIPYSIQRAYPSDDIRDSNTYTNYYCIEKEKLKETIINTIIEFVYEFCCEDIGHNIQITSYNDFCDKFWEPFMVRGWYYIFKVYYFEDKWIEWDVEEYQEQIYLAYQKLLDMYI